ncbi:MAG TPA: hypothetical protein VHN39_11880, partial [Phenylobacterium sp.]|nr:hypothetical protein [Phenylobacterium sp.]
MARFQRLRQDDGVPKRLAGLQVQRGERTRTVRAFDAQTGKELWRSAPLHANPVVGITGSPVVSGDQVFVPL